MKLELDGLTKEFGDFTAVNHINLTMTNGVYGLLGVNGAGKTTLMRMLCTLLKPTSGTICCNGKDKSLYARMAELLWNSGHEDQHRKPERMAVPPDTDVYLEAVETSEDEKEETHRSGSRQPLCGNHSIRSKRILV